MAFKTHELLRAAGSVCGDSFSRARIADGLLDLLYPPECCWCGRSVPSGQRLCGDCRKVLLSDYYRCQKCATPLPGVIPNHDCFRCRDAKWKFSSVVTLGPYRGELRRAAILMKKPRFELLRQALGGLLAELLTSHFSGSFSESERPLIVPVPNHWTHNFSSAANTADLLASAIASATHWQITRGAVRRIRKTAKQGMLSWAERRQNVRGAFAIRSTKFLSGRHVMLVDDVLTSGATAAELAKLLIRAGAAQVTVVVAARGTGVREAISPNVKN